ncbi:MAG TPA: hypothetical protein VHP83_09915 [Aggregatilineaceae bacterium]|nr:hypothetical protein [Aggregatilineaceae bacterium]
MSLNFDDPYADPYNQYPDYPQLYNPEDISRWLQYPPEQVVLEVFVEIMQQQQIIRGLARLAYEYADAETVIIARSQNSELDLKSLSEKVVIATNIMRRILDTASAYSRIQRERKNPDEV